MDRHLRLQEKLSYKFKDISLLKAALTHSSFANEKRCQTSYERLEFLGDSVLSLVISEYLYKEYPSLPEGELTRTRAAIVCEQSLAEAAIKLDIGSYLFLGKGEELTGGRSRVSILSDVFESVVAAIYLDSGLEAAKKWILENLGETVVQAVEGKILRDYKTILQEILQSMNQDKIEYRLVGETGPEHSKTFIMEIYNQDRLLGRGDGKSKKEAEQSAAKDALEKLNYEVD